MQYYVIEGIDTSGKTTQCTLIKERYPCTSLFECKDSLKKIVLLNEPGGTELGNLLREILLNKRVKMSENSAFLLFLAQRAELFSHIRHLSSKIIADRSLISGMAYARTIKFCESLRLNLFATGGILPQKIVFLELSKEALKNRLRQKQLDTIELKGIEYLMEIQNRFKEILKYLQTQEVSDMILQHTVVIDKDSKMRVQTPEILTLNAELSKEELHDNICSFFGI